MLEFMAMLPTEHYLSCSRLEFSNDKMKKGHSETGCTLSIVGIFQILSVFANFTRLSLKDGVHFSLPVIL